MSRFPVARLGIKKPETRSTVVNGLKGVQDETLGSDFTDGHDVCDVHRVLRGTL